MRILLSNDDEGFTRARYSEALAKALRESLLIIRSRSPDRNRSGASNSLTLESSLRTFTFDNGDIAVQMGTPTDCVYLGVSNALMRPRRILSFPLTRVRITGDDVESIPVLSPRRGRSSSRLSGDSGLP